MNPDERVMRWLLWPPGYPLFPVVVFAALGIGASLFTRRLAWRLAVSVVGTVLALLVALLIVWEQASGS